MSSLHEFRLRAAEYSEGFSSTPVYELVLAICSGVDLGNDLLDFGPGRCFFVERLLTSGYGGALTCADLLPRPASLPERVRWIAADLNDPLPLPDQSFDTIISTDVVAHLENPRFVFREFSRLLRPNGSLVVTTSNQESIRAITGLIFGEHFAAFRGVAYPALITALLREDFRRICAESGFIPPRFYYSDSGLVPKLHLSWQRLSLGLLKGRAFSDHLAVATRKA